MATPVKIGAVLLSALLCHAAAAVAQTAPAYPVKPVRIIVPFPAGGTSDILARAVGQKLAEQWKQQVLVDNRPGAGANIGAELAARAAPDGYTLFLLSTIHSINPSLYPNLSYHPVRDFAPVSLIALTSQVLAVHPSVPVRTVTEFISYAKKNPGQLNYSSAGSGSQPHLTAELFKARTGINIVHVPYKGAPQAITDLVGGQVALTFATAPSAVPHVKSGRLRALGVSTLKRIAALPEVPPIAESGVPGFEASGANGLVGPAGLAPALVERLNAQVVAIVREAAMNQYLNAQGAEPYTTTPAEYAAYIKADVEKWAKAVKDSGAKID